MAGQQSSRLAGRLLGRRICCKVNSVYLTFKMSIDKVVPVARFISSFLADTITMLFIEVHFYGSHTFPYQSLLLSTIVLNGYYTFVVFLCVVSVCGFVCYVSYYARNRCN